MFSLLFSLVSCENNVCLYYTHPNFCTNKSWVQIAYRDMEKKFKDIQIDSNSTLIFHIVENHTKRYYIPTHLFNVKRLAFISHEISREIYLDYNQLLKPLTKYTFKNLIIKNVTCHLNISRLELIHSRFDELPSNAILYFHILDADEYSLSPFSVLNSGERAKAYINIGDLSTLPNSPYLKLDGNLIATYRFYIHADNLSVNLLGDDIYFSHPSTLHKLHFVSLSAATPHVLYCALPNSTFSMNCYARGPHYYNIKFTVILNNNVTLAFPKSLWPETLDSIIIIGRLGPANIKVAHYRVPAKIAASHYPLTMIADSDYCGFYNSLQLVSDELTVMASRPDQHMYLVIEYLFSTKKNNITVQNKSPNLELFIRDFSTSEDTIHRFLGEGSYCIRKYPDQICKLIFSSLRLRTATSVNIPFSLNKSASIVVEKNLTLKYSVFVPDFNDLESTSPSYVESFLGHTYNFICAPELDPNNFEVQFSSETVNRGFSRGNEIFEKIYYQKDGLKCVGMNMTKKYSDVGYQFCINPNNKKYACDSDHISITTKEEFKTWQKYINPDINLIEFVIVDPIYEDDNKTKLLEYNFDKFNATDLSIIFRSQNNQMKSILLDPNVLFRGIQYISFKLIDVHINEAWHDVIKTSLYLTNSVINHTRSYSMMKGPYEITTDAYSYKYLYHLFPSQIKFNNDFYSKAIIKRNEIQLKNDDGDTISIPVVSMKPAVSMKITMDFEIENQDETNTNVAPLMIDSFGSNILKITGDFDPRSHNIQISNFQDSTIMTTDELVPIESQDGGFIINSTQDTIRIEGHVNLNGNVGFNPKSSDGVVKIKSASFGPNTNIDQSTFSRLEIEHADFTGTTPEKLSKIHVSKVFNVDMGASVRMTNFTFDDNAIFNLSFVPGILPYVVIDMDEPLYNKKANLVLSLNGYFVDYETLNNSYESFNNRSLEILCGKNLICSNWNMSFYTSRKFPGDLPFTLQCRSSFLDRNCIQIHAYPAEYHPDHNDDKDKDKRKKIIGISIGIIATLIVVTVVVVLVCLRRKKGLKLANETRSLLSTDSMGVSII